MASFVWVFLRSISLRTWLYAGAVLVVIGAYGSGHHRGYKSADDACKAAAALEAARQAEIARQSMDDAQERLDRLTQRKDALELQLRVNEDEAQNDVSASQCGLPASGVQRLKRIGGGNPK